MSKILKLNIKDLVIDTALSGRSSQELKANAKELAPSLANGWDEAIPGQVFKRGKDWHLAAGFTRATFLSSQPDAVGYFVEIPDDPKSLRIACIKTNNGKPISPIEKGRIFAEMMAGSDPEKLAVGEEAMPSMTAQEVAEAAGMTKEGVSYCVSLYNASPEIRQLMADDKVSANVVELARKAATDKKTGELNESLQMKAIKAAIRNADGNKATPKHFDAIKAEVFPLKAVSTKPKQSEPIPQAADVRKPDGDETETQSEDEQQPEKPAQQPEGMQSLGVVIPAPATKPKKEDKNALISRFASIIMAADVVAEVGISEGKASIFAESLVEAGATLPESPI